MITMRTIPVDAERVRLISTGVITAVIAWIVLADGSRRPDPAGRQDVDEATGLPLWRVEVIMPADEGDERDKTAVTEITLACREQPDPGAFGDVLTFEGLAMSPGYLNRKTGQLTTPRWTATGIRKHHGAKAQPQAA
jgi:hypothetical protein